MTSALQQIRQEEAHFDKQQLDGIRASIRGHLCFKGSAGYDEARTIWNAPRPDTDRSLHTYMGDILLSSNA
jgi:hypothetical protein